MTKMNFLYELDEKLAGLPNEDRERSIEYYSEMIDDRIEDGLSEAEAVAALGSTDAIASQIISEIPLPRLIKERFKPKNSLGVWSIILSVFGFLIIGIPVLAVLFSVVISIIATVFAVSVSLFAVPIALLSCGIGGIVAFFPLVFSGDAAVAFFLLGAAFICLGLVIPFFYLAVYAMKFTVLTVKGTALAIKKCFIKRR